MTHVTNSLQGLESGKISQRLAYAFFLLVGLLFLISAVITAFGMASVLMMDAANESGYRYLLFVCYMALNLLMSYGFIFCRAWLIPILGVQGISMIGLYLYQTVMVPSDAPRSIFGMVAFIVLFLIAYKNRRLLHGIRFRKTIVIIFMVLTLMTYFLVHSSLLY